MDRHKDKGKKDFERFLRKKKQAPTHKIDYTETEHYKQLARTSFLEDHYASIHANYSTVEELNALIIEFYKPNCSLHLNVSDDVLLKNPDMYDIVAYPGQGHCPDKVKDTKKKIKNK